MADCWVSEAAGSGYLFGLRPLVLLLYSEDWQKAENVQTVEWEVSHSGRMARTKVGAASWM